MTQSNTNTTPKGSDNTAPGKDVHRDHTGRDDHGNIADPDLQKDEARAASRNFGSKVLGRSMWLILILMPIIVAIAYFATR